MEKRKLRILHLLSELTGTFLLLLCGFRYFGYEWPSAIESAGLFTGAATYFAVRNYWKLVEEGVDEPVDLLSQVRRFFGRFPEKPDKFESK
jgi:hypothetical protein